MKKTFTALVLPLICSGCMTTSLSEKGRMVEPVHDERKIEGCQFVGTVEGNAGYAGITRARALRSALNQMANRAGDRGATHLLYPGDLENRPLTSSQEITGKAYRCKTND